MGRSRVAHSWPTRPRSRRTPPDRQRTSRPRRRRHLVSPCGRRSMRGDWAHTERSTAHRQPTVRSGSRPRGRPSMRHSRRPAARDRLPPLTRLERPPGSDGPTEVAADRLLPRPEGCTASGTVAAPSWSCTWRRCPPQTPRPAYPHRAVAGFGAPGRSRAPTAGRSSHRRSGPRRAVSRGWRALHRPKAG